MQSGDGVNMNNQSNEIQLKKRVIAKLALIVRHCDALEADANLCLVSKNRVELMKIIAVDCSELILNYGSQQEKRPPERENSVLETSREDTFGN